MEGKSVLPMPTGPFLSKGGSIVEETQKGLRQSICGYVPTVALAYATYLLVSMPVQIRQGYKYVSTS